MPKAVRYSALKFCSKTGIGKRRKTISSGSNIYPRCQRLLTPGDFSRVFDQVSVRAGTKELFLLASPSASLNAPRLGFIIARKQVKKAVHRNRIKRIFREEFRHLECDYPGLDIIVMAKKGSDTLPNLTLHQTVQYLFRKLRKRHTTKLTTALPIGNSTE